MLLRACRYYWRAIAATVILVVVGVMAISIMVTRPSFRAGNGNEALSCPSMLSPTTGDMYSPYSYGQQVSGMSAAQLDEYFAGSGLDNYTGDALDHAYQRVNMNLALTCSDLKASQQGRLVATLGVGTFLLAFLAVPYGSVRRGRRES